MIEHARLAKLFTLIVMGVGVVWPLSTVLTVLSYVKNL